MSHGHAFPFQKHQFYPIYKYIYICLAFIAIFQALCQFLLNKRTAGLQGKACKHNNPLPDEACKYSTARGSNS